MSTPSQVVVVQPINSVQVNTKDLLKWTRYLGIASGACAGLFGFISLILCVSTVYRGDEGFCVFSSLWNIAIGIMVVMIEVPFTSLILKLVLLQNYMIRGVIYICCSIFGYFGRISFIGPSMLIVTGILYIIIHLNGRSDKERFTGTEYVPNKSGLSSGTSSTTSSV